MRLKLLNSLLIIRTGAWCADSAVAAGVVRNLINRIEKQKERKEEEGKMKEENWRKGQRGRQFNRKSAGRSPGIQELSDYLRS